MGVKLVRDRIGEVPWPDRYHGDPLGEAAKRYLGRVDPWSAEYATLLDDKFPEEVAELLTAEGVEAVMEEAADLFEAILAKLVQKRVAPSRGSAQLWLVERAMEKYKARGGFLTGRTYSGPVRDTHPHSGTVAR